VVVVALATAGHDTSWLDALFGSVGQNWVELVLTLPFAL